MSSPPRYPGQKTIHPGLPFSRRGECVGRYIPRRGSVGRMWRRGIRGVFKRHDNIPCSSRIGFTKTMSGRQGGFDIFPRRVGPGTWYPHHLPVLVVIELNSTTTQKEPNQEPNVTTRLANTQTSSNDSLNAWVFVHSL